MWIYYTDGFPIPLPERHVFPIDKYRRLRERLQADPALSDATYAVAPSIADADLHLAHDHDYVAAVRDHTLPAEQVRRIGFPWSAAVVERALRSAGATRAALEPALTDGAAVYLGGGTHHAGRARGGGYCIFNDCAVAALAALRDRADIGRVLIADLDVHQGDGTAEIFAEEPRVFTFSMHGARNYPRIKPPSDLDVGLPDGCDDATYIEALDVHLPRAFERAEPDLVFYLAGADPHRGDRFGRMGLTRAGLAARDRRVFAKIREHAVPVVVTMAGGYGKDLDVTVDVQFETVRQAAGLAGTRGASIHFEA